eukprot:355657-Chlamydomonas_euryale.AAC.12
MSSRYADVALCMLLNPHLNGMCCVCGSAATHTYSTTGALKQKRLSAAAHEFLRALSGLPTTCHDRYDTIYSRTNKLVARKKRRRLRQIVPPVCANEPKSLPRIVVNIAARILNCIVITPSGGHLASRTAARRSIAV